MERLTMTSDKGGVAFTFDLDITCEKSEIMKILKIAEKLKEYEDLEEKGKLLKLPCAVGDTIYRVEECGEITPMEVLHVTFFGDEIQLTCKELKKYEEVHHYRPGFSIGKKVFYSKEAAEAALEEMRE